mmetsp:Transcript_45993/g.80809  ORF Transcript_45993/g.80809 Transcript_45993/m.80809 type:complete len:268 (+) Transcript_45993:648-1451(+)
MLVVSRHQFDAQVFIDCIVGRLFLTRLTQSALQIWVLCFLRLPIWPLPSCGARLPTTLGAMISGVVTIHLCSDFCAAVGRCKLCIGLRHSSSTGRRAMMHSSECSEKLQQPRRSEAMIHEQVREGHSFNLCHHDRRHILAIRYFDRSWEEVNQFGWDVAVPIKLSTHHIARSRLHNVHLIQRSHSVECARCHTTDKLAFSLTGRFCYPAKLFLGVNARVHCAMIYVGVCMRLPKDQLIIGDAEFLQCVHRYLAHCSHDGTNIPSVAL